MAIQKSTKERVLAVFAIFIVIALGLHFFAAKIHAPTRISPASQPTPTLEPSFGIYHLPTIQKKDYYRIAMVGDSMTAALGPHGGALSEKLNLLYKSQPGHQKILIDNYAQGGTNILGLSKQMSTKITSGDVVFDPLLSRSVDMIIIESFGYNPLSQFSLDEGHAKETQVLDQTMKLLTKEHPNTAIIFVATIAPNNETYAKEEIPDLSISDRVLQAQERVSYIKNHIAFARAHNIPLIDIYDTSLTPDGDGNILYINPNDHIHPSFAGVDFIDEQIANALYESKILPE